jgi:two-component system cell cycle sensor histidine kinase/response regulator CckA
MLKRSTQVLNAGAALLGVAAGLSFGLDWPWAPPLGAVLAAAALGLLALAWRAGAAAPKKPAAGAMAELIQMASESSAEGLLIATWDGVGMYANKAFRDLFFIDGGDGTDGAGTLLSQVERMLDSQGRSKDAFAKLRAAATDGKAAGGEVICRRRDGKPAWRRLRVEPFGPEGVGAGAGDGAARYVQWRAQDITEEKRTLAARQSAEARRADLLDGLPVGIFSVDARGRIVYANSCLAGWLGVDRVAMGGRPFAEFVTSASPVGGNGDDDDAQGDHGLVTLRAADGTEFTASLLQSHRETTDGTLVYTRSILLRDMAWLDDGNGNGADNGLGPAKRLRFLFDDAPVAIALLDGQGRVMDCNRAFLTLAGAHRDLVAGHPFAERLLPEDRDVVAAALSDVIMGKVRATQTEIRLAAPGGRQAAATLFASRMEDDKGNITGLVLHFIDTTEQKNLEIQFAQSQKMQAVGQLAGGVAHDFNNLLTAMIGFTDLLLDRHGPGDPSFNDLQQIKQNAHRATNLVRQLLAFSRKQNLEPDLLDPEDALNDLSNLLRRLLGETVKLKLEHERGAGRILADRGQFDQVIINLAVNARDAMPEGGPLVIRTFRRDLERALQQSGEVIPVGSYLVIEVEDKGTGIPKDVLDRIFEPFFSTKEVGQGTGLGLSTVYGIIHQSGGYVTVESHVGKGTIFRLLFPRADEEARAQAQEAAASEVAAAAAEAAQLKAQGKGKGKEPELPLFEADLTGSETILLVEDEDAVRMFGARALRNKGYKVLEAQNGEAALDVVNGTAAKIDLIVSDVVMPGMDGYNLVRTLREQMPEVKVILMSGYAEDAFQDQIDKDETLHFLPKPFTLKTLVGKVKEIIVSEGL